jgi:hypothetical protein
MFSGGPSEALIRAMRRVRARMVKKVERAYSREVTGQQVSCLPEGDMLFRHASVTGKYASHGKKDIELALMAQNQDGELSARGPAVAQLPG